MLTRFAFVLTLLAALAAPALTKAENTLRVKINSDILSLDPGLNTDFNSRNVINVLLEGLVAYREDGSIGLLLADALETSPDGLKYRFTLRKGVTFHNGAPLDAEAVAFAWRRYLDPEKKWRCLTQFDGRLGAKILRISTPDPDNVVFELDKPNPQFLAQMARLDCASAGVFHKESLDAQQNWVNPIGTGPFKLGTWRSGVFLELDKFAAYRSRAGPRDGMTGDKTPLLDKVRLIVVPAERVRTALFGSQIDLDPDLSVSSVEAFRNHEDFEVTVHSSAELTGLLFQTTDPVLADPRMRRAILLGLDRELLARQVYQGLIGTTHSPVPPNNPLSSETQRTPLPYDPVQARRLLAEIGYTGQTIQMVASKRYTSTYLSAIVAQSMLKDIGLNIHLEEIEWGKLFEMYSKGNYQMMVFPYSARLDAALYFEMLTGPKSSQPHKVWDDQTAHALVQRAMASGDVETRKGILDQIHLRFVEDLPMIPLWNSPGISVRHKRVKGFQPWGSETPRYWGIWIE